MFSSVKCKKCRSVIFTEDECKLLFLNAHGEELQTTEVLVCNVDNVVFLHEDHVPQWLRIKIEEDNWSKGRINCPQCDSRIGAFNFVSGQKCDCSCFVLPCIHVIRSKVDLIKL